jgi:hypothetical protein
MTAITMEENQVLDLQLEPREALLPAARSAGSVSVPSGTTLVMELLGRGATMDQMDRILAMHERLEATEALKAHNAAVASMTSEDIEVIKRKFVQFQNKSGGVTEYWHAELSDLTDAVRPHLSKYGLSMNWRPTHQERDWLEITCYLKHVRGHAESATLGGMPDSSGGKNSIQAIGSTATYLARYTAKLLLGIAEKGQDNDGRGDTPDGAPPPVDTRVHIEATADTYPAADFDRNLPVWRGYIESGRKTPNEIIAMVRTKKPFSDDQERRLRAFKSAVPA